MSDDEIDAIDQEEFEDLRRDLQAERTAHAETKRRLYEVEDALAPSTDLANTWARETGGVEEANNPLGLHRLLDRLWGAVSGNHHRRCEDLERRLADATNAAVRECAGVICNYCAVPVSEGFTLEDYGLGPEHVSPRGNSFTCKSGHLRRRFPSAFAPSTAAHSHTERGQDGAITLLDLSAQDPVVLTVDAPRIADLEEGKGEGDAQA